MTASIRLPAVQRRSRDTGQGSGSDQPAGLFPCPQILLAVGDFYLNIYNITLQTSLRFLELHFFSFQPSLCSSSPQRWTQTQGTCSKFHCK